jgi:hypothetical protein
VRCVAKPRILLYDIETTHNVVAKFSLREEYVAHTNILQERYVVCGSWKELGEKRTHAVSVLDNPKLYKQDPHDDRHVVETLHEVLSGADVVIAHNGDKFDWKWVQGRVLKHGLSPLPPVRSVDTLKVARKMFSLNSNRLDYLGKYLGVGQKKSTPPGLWIDVLKGDKSAIRKMVDYNKVDVELLEDVFLKLRPFIPDYNVHALFGAGVVCPRCGSTEVQQRGYHASLTQVYKRMQCMACSGGNKTRKGGWFRLRTSEKEMTAAVRSL